MTHEYSKFKNKNIPYAKVGRRVFNSLMCSLSPRLMGPPF